MLLNRHHPTHPQSVIPAVTLPPPHRPTDRRLPNASPFTDQVARWYGQWVGGLVEFSVIPLCLDQISCAVIFTMCSDQKMLSTVRTRARWLIKPKMLSTVRVRIRVPTSDCHWRHVENMDLQMGMHTMNIIIEISSRILMNLYRCMRSATLAERHTLLRTRPFA